MKLSESILGKIFVGVAIAVLVPFFLFQFGLTPEPNSPTPAPGSNPPIVITQRPPAKERAKRPVINYSKEKATIKKLLYQAADLSAGAAKTLNVSNLNNIYRGNALRTMKAFVSEQKNNGVFQLAQLNDQSISSIDLTEENGTILAKVEMSETWSGHIHRVYDNFCLFHFNYFKQPQTVYLEKESRVWYITDLVIHDLEPNLIPCNRYE